MNRKADGIGKGSPETSGSTAVPKTLPARHPHSVPKQWKAGRCRQYAGGNLPMRTWQQSIPAFGLLQQRLLQGLAGCAWLRLFITLAWLRTSGFVQLLPKLRKLLIWRHVAWTGLVRQQCAAMRWKSWSNCEDPCFIASTIEPWRQGTLVQRLTAFIDLP